MQYAPVVIVACNIAHSGSTHSAVPPGMAACLFGYVLMQTKVRSYIGTSCGDAGTEHGRACPTESSLQLCFVASQLRTTVLAVSLLFPRSSKTLPLCHRRWTRLVHGPAMVRKWSFITSWTTWHFQRIDMHSSHYTLSQLRNNVFADHTPTDGQSVPIVQ